MNFIAFANIASPKPANNPVKNRNLLLLSLLLSNWDIPSIAVGISNNIPNMINSML